ncbi:MAG: glycosyltransferase family 4 protein [Microgenomates group bacterium]
MKIVQLVKLYSPHIGGVETHVSSISEVFAAMDHEVTVLTSQLSADQDLTQEENGVKIVRRPFSYFEKKFRTWWWILQNWKLFREADVVHVHDVGWWILPVLPLISKKFYITFHGWETDWPIPQKSKLLRWILAKCAKGTIHVGSWIQEFYWDRPTVITYGGVKLTSEVLSKETPHKKDPLSIIFVGRLSDDTGVYVYLELIDLLKESWPGGVEVTWVGDGPLRSLCESTGSVTGMVDFPEKHIPPADLVFASSYLSMLLAQALGKIVISTYDSPLKRRYIETYPGQQTILHSDNPHQLLQRIISLAKDKKQWQEMQKKSKQTAEKMTWIAVADQYARLWEK